MKAAGLFNIKDIRVVDTEKPSLEPGDVLMKVESATTCGTDLKTYLRGYPKLDFPIMPWGHECAGTVAQVGEGCTKFEVGDRITTSNPAPCMKCFYCKRGRPDLCEDNILALGAYAEYFRIPSRLVELNTFKIPDNMSYAQASLIEPISSAIHGFMRADCENLGDAVAVIGAGAQGLSHIQFAKLSGATKIIAIDMVNKRLELAEQLGATHTINGNDTNVEDTVLDLTEGRGCDLVIEAVGTVQTWESAVRMARKAGTVLEYGGCAKGTSFTVDTGRIHYDGLTITGCTNKTPESVEITWNLMVTGALKTEQMITREMKLEDIGEAYKSLEHEKTDIKISIVP